MTDTTGAWINRQIASLYPGSFALVMATGIVSNAFFNNRYQALSDVLFALNVVAYITLTVLTCRRAFRFRRELLADLINPHTVFSFFTIVAGTDVLGVSASLRGFVVLAVVLWLLAIAIWVVLIYFSFAVLTFLNTAHGANVVHGGWLIAIVGTESLVVLGTSIAPFSGGASISLFVLLHLLWGVGLGLYAIFISLFAYRIFFFDVEPDDLSPLVWVVMGAAAISTNAGSTLILSTPNTPFLLSMRPFIDGITLLMWGWATWWIPLLLVFGFWKHVICKVRFSYTPMFWSLVFPVGMYAVASMRLALAADFPPLKLVSGVIVWIAFGAWLLTAFGFVRATWRSYAARNSAATNAAPAKDK
ncbi:MAG: tellurite resistance/C4-dicarboxylate transporter family protein [Devosia sp.]